MKAMKKEMKKEMTAEAKAWAVVKGDFAEAILDGFWESVEFVSMCMGVVSILAIFFYFPFLVNSGFPIYRTAEIPLYRVVIGMAVCLVVAIGNGVVSLKVNHSYFTAKSKCYYKGVSKWFETRPVLSRTIDAVNFVGYWMAKLAAFLVVALGTGVFCAISMVKPEKMTDYLSIAMIPVVLYAVCVVFLWKTAKER